MLEVKNMKALKCDRCGGFYDLYGMKNDAKNANGLRLLNVDANRVAYVHDFIDMCPECMKKLYEFLKGEGNGRT